MSFWTNYQFPSSKKLLSFTCFLTPFFVTVSLPSKAAEIAVYCSETSTICITLSNLFTRETGIKINLTEFSDSVALQRLDAEFSNPKADIWWGGSIALHLTAAEKTLTQEYEAARLWQLRSWAVAMAWASGYRTVGVNASRQSFSINELGFREIGLQAPTCWSHLEEFDKTFPLGIAGTTTPKSAFLPLIPLIGRNRASDLYRKVRSSAAAHIRPDGMPKVILELRLGSDPYSFTDRVGWIEKTPCEGVSFAMSAMSIVRGTRKFTEAEVWFDWMLSPRTQTLIQRIIPDSVPASRSSSGDVEIADQADIFLNSSEFQQAIGMKSSFKAPAVDALP